MKTVLVARGPGRLAVLAGKVGALGLVLLGVVLATFAVDAAASWLVAVATSHPVVDVLLRWTPATNAGSLAAALGVPVQGAPGARRASRPWSTGHTRPWSSPRTW